MDASLKKKRGNCRHVEARNVLQGLSVFGIPITGQNCVHTLPLFKVLLKVSITRLFK